MVMDKTVAAALLMERTVREIYTDRSSSAIQPLQWSIMRFLKSAATSDAHVSSISRYLGTSHAPVSRAISTLIRRGLVERDSAPEVSRRSPVVLTLAGMEMLKSDPILKVAERLEELPEDERRSLERALRHLALNTSYQLT